MIPDDQKVGFIQRDPRFDAISRLDWTDLVKAVGHINDVFGFHPPDAITVTIPTKVADSINSTLSATSPTRVQAGFKRRREEVGQDTYESSTEPPLKK